MSEPITTSKKSDVVTVEAVRVACDGPVFSKHPRVYLTMVDDAKGKPDHVVCPYCSRVFKYIGKDGQQAGQAHS